MALANSLEGNLRVSPALEKVLLAFVWITFVANALIIMEPAPADLFMMAFVVAMPLFGMVRFTTVHATLLAAWMIIVATGLLVAGGNEHFTDSAKHMLITLYLAVFCVALAGFVTKDPARYLPVIWRGYIIGALIAAVAGIVGYFDLIPGSYDLFTRYWRARGTFKDANVFAPFLVPALLICMHSVIVNRVKHSLVPIMLVLIFFSAIMLSFSRGGWMVLTVAAGIYLAHFFLLSATPHQRLKIVVTTVFGLLLLAGLVAVAAQSSKVRLLLEHRVFSEQSFENSTNMSRFIGHQKAARLIVENPFGIGALYFSSFYHYEQPHNVYLSMFLSSGWFGGAVYLILVIATIVIGFLVLLKKRPWMHYHSVAYGTFVGLAIEGYIIDTDHWRQFFILMAVVWGAYASVHRGDGVVEAAKPTAAQAA